MWSAAYCLIVTTRERQQQPPVQRWQTSAHVHHHTAGLLIRNESVCRYDSPVVCSIFHLLLGNHFHLYNRKQPADVLVDLTFDFPTTRTRTMQSTSLRVWHNREAFLTHPRENHRRWTCCVNCIAGEREREIFFDIQLDLQFTLSIIGEATRKRTSQYVHPIILLHE